MSRTKPKFLYSVEVCYFNPNANYRMKVGATSAINALWVASERLFQNGDRAYASIGEIKRIAW